MPGQGHSGDVTAVLTADHVKLNDPFAARRYFAKFDRITRHLARVAAAMETGGRLSKTDVAVLRGHVEALDRTFEALSMKYLLSGRGAGFGALEIDVHESGFPVFAELLTMANDAQQAERHLRNMPTEAELKDQMIRTIVGDLEVPTRLQYALSQRLYYQALRAGGLFWAENDPEVLWQGNSEDESRRRYLLHWAVYDSQLNLPTIYLLELEDTGRSALPKDQARWAGVQRHLMAQSVAGLKLLTIAQGLDRDFDDIHPKRLRRIHVGPMYSSAFTRQSGPISQVLEQANAPAGEDWALAWTTEELESERVKVERKGWFGEVEREIFALDPFAGRGIDTGATRTERAVILPERPFQALAELDPPGFREVRKFVVSPGGRVVGYR